jgi:hypothetical protein
MWLCEKLKSGGLQFQSSPVKKVCKTSSQKMWWCVPIIPEMAKSVNWLFPKWPEQNSLVEWFKWWSIYPASAKFWVQTLVLPKNIKRKGNSVIYCNMNKPWRYLLSQVLVAHIYNPTFGKCRQENCEFEPSLGYIAGLCLKTKTKNHYAKWKKPISKKDCMKG